MNFKFFETVLQNSETNQWLGSPKRKTVLVSSLIETGAKGGNVKS